MVSAEFVFGATTIVEIRFAESTADDMDIVLIGLVNLTAANFVL
jgi:hypothetical protein